MLPTASNGISYSEHEIVQARSSHLGKLSRLLSKFRPLLKGGEDGFQKPRRSIDRDLQERWPIELL